MATAVVDLVVTGTEQFDTYVALAELPQLQTLKFLSPELEVKRQNTPSAEAGHFDVPAPEAQYVNPQH